MTDTGFTDVYEETSPNGETPPQEVYEPQPQEETRPTEHFARASGADFFTWIARGLGTALVQSGKDVPVGRVISFQAPITGNKLDHLIAHSWIDGLLQPLFRKTGELEGLGAILVLPLLVGAMERSPSAAPMIAELMRPAVYATFSELAPLLRKQKRDDKRIFRTVADLNEEFGLDRDADPFDAFMNAIFGDQTEGQEGEPEAA
jgi:hypothetical protein